jgi:hypothetical protein
VFLTKTAKSQFVSRTLSFSGLPPTWPRARAAFNLPACVADDIALELGLLQFSAKR